jgi:hypothetical protein
MTEEYYKYFREQFARLAEMSNKSAENKERFLQQVLFAASGILGILVALHSVPPICQHIRLVFVSATVLLSLCILTSGIALFDYSLIAWCLREAFRIELEKSLPFEKKMKDVFANLKKRTVFCEKCSLISFFISLVLLVIYTAMITL